MRDSDRSNARFASTHWSLVKAAGHASSPGSDAALEQLCQDYWYPLYAFARRQGCAAAQAEDHTQGFFTRVLEKNYLQTADPERGRFRAFLLTMFKRYLAKEYQKDQAVKRGGAMRRLSLDFEEGENRYRTEPTDAWTPEKLFQRRWALTVLERVMGRLKEHFAASDNMAFFEASQVLLVSDKVAGGQSEIARKLDMSEGALRVAVHRMRARYRQLLLEEVAHTVTNPDDCQRELEYLQAALRGES